MDRQEEINAAVSHLSGAFRTIIDSNPSLKIDLKAAEHLLIAEDLLFRKGDKSMLQARRETPVAGKEHDCGCKGKGRRVGKVPFDIILTVDIQTKEKTFVMGEKLTPHLVSGDGTVAVLYAYDSKMLLLTKNQYARAESES